MTQLPWKHIGLAQAKMRNNQHRPGNMSVLVNPPRSGRKFNDTLAPACGA